MKKAGTIFRLSYIDTYISAYISVTKWHPRFSSPQKDLVVGITFPEDWRGGGREGGMSSHRHPTLWWIQSHNNGWTVVISGRTDCESELEATQRRTHLTFVTYRPHTFGSPGLACIVTWIRYISRMPIHRVGDVSALLVDRTSPPCRFQLGALARCERSLSLDFTQSHDTHVFELLI